MSKQALIDPHTLMHTNLSDPCQDTQPLVPDVPDLVEIGACQEGGDEEIQSVLEAW